jgi:hypothetical protein
LAHLGSSAMSAQHTGHQLECLSVGGVEWPCLLSAAALMRPADEDSLATVAGIEAGQQFTSGG